MQRDAKKEIKKIYKIYFKVMFNHLIRLYIAVLVCVLLISVYSAVLSHVGQNLIMPHLLTVKVNGDCKNYTAHAQSIFQCNVCGKKIMTIGARSCHPHHTSSHIIQS